MGLVKTFNFLVKLSFGRDLFISYRTAILIPLFSLALYFYALFPSFSVDFSMTISFLTLGPQPRETFFVHYITFRDKRFLILYSKW